MFSKWLAWSVPAVVAVCAAVCQAHAQVVVDPPSVDFGRVRPGTRHTAHFVLHNAGAAAATVRAAVPTCKCTDVGLAAGSVIPAGGSLAFDATLSVPTTPGAKDAKVQIVLEGASAPLLAELKAVAALPIEASPEYVDALKGKSQGTVVVKSEDGKPFSVVSADGQPPVFVGFDPAKDAPRSEYTLAWTFTPPSSGTPRLWWVVATDRADAPLIALRVRNEATGARSDPAMFDRYWWVPEQLVLADRLEAGKPVTLSMDMQHYNPKGRGAVVRADWSSVQSVKSLSSDATASLISASPAGDHATVVVQFTPAPGARGFVWAPVEITTATGSGSVPVVAWVVEPSDESPAGK